MVVHQNTKTQIQMVAPFGNGLFWIQSLKPRSNFLSSFTGLGVRMTGCQVLMTATRLQIGAAESTCILTCRQIISHLTQSLQIFLSGSIQKHSDLSIHSLDSLDSDSEEGRDSFDCHRQAVQTLLPRAKTSCKRQRPKGKCSAVPWIPRMAMGIKQRMPTSET